MNRPGLVGFDRACIIDRITNDIDDAAKGFFTDGNGNRLAGVLDFLAAHQAFRRIHGDCAHTVFPEMLGDFQHEAVAIIVGFQGIQNGGQFIIKLHVDDRAHYLSNLSDGLSVCHCSFLAPMRI